MSSETKLRSLVKAVVWRVIATIVTFGMLYVLTGKVVQSIEATIVAAFVSMIAYYFHERLWNTIAWGRIER
ncbi:MAG: hypothetical protein RL681_15 [Candidatus Parcubacteria bacterium]|jgi:uncharacterized membrane protein